MFALLFLLITLMVQTGVSGDDCSDGWFEHGEQCVRYMSEPKNHTDAQAECKKMGANLVSVHCPKEYKQFQYIIKHVTNKDGETWIGGVDLNKNNNWTWLDGSEFDFTSWCVGQPDNIGTQDCLQMNYTEKKCWDNMECGNARPYLCAK